MAGIARCIVTSPFVSPLPTIVQLAELVLLKKQVRADMQKQTSATPLLDPLWLPVLGLLNYHALISSGWTLESWSGLQTRERQYDEREYRAAYREQVQEGPPYIFEAEAQIPRSNVSDGHLYITRSPQLGCAASIHSVTKLCHSRLFCFVF